MRLKTCPTAFMALVIVFMVIPAFQAQAQTARTATLKVLWDYDNPPEDLAGFRLYQSDISGKYTIGKGHEVATAPAEARTLTLPNVPEGTHFWVLTAFDSSGNESEPSVEASRRVDMTPPHEPGDVQVEVEVLVNVTTRRAQERE